MWSEKLNNLSNIVDAECDETQCITAYYQHMHIVWLLYPTITTLL